MEKNALGIVQQGEISSAVVFPAIYIIALGTGGIKPNVRHSLYFW